MTPDELTEIRARHESSVLGGGPDRPVLICARCDTDWPCDAEALLAELDAVRVQIGNLKTVIAGLLEFTADMEDSHGNYPPKPVKAGWKALGKKVPKQQWNV